MVIFCRHVPTADPGFANLKHLCEACPYRHRIKVSDVLAHPDADRTDQIVASPTLIRRSPNPTQTPIGEQMVIGRLLALGWTCHLCTESRKDSMAKKSMSSDTAAFEKSVKVMRPKEKYVLRLYVAGINPRSSAAIRNVTSICEEHLKDCYELEIVDIYQQPMLAKGEQIIAAPTLIKKLPQPLRRFIGDMANKDRILVGLDLRPKK